MAYPHSASSDSLIMEILKAGLRHKIIVIAVFGICVLSTLTYLRYAIPEYTVVFKVTPVVPEQSPGNRLGGLAGLAGITLQRDTNAMAFDLYLEGLKGRMAADELAATDAIVKRMFAGEWDASSQVWRQPVPTTSRVIVQKIKDTIGVYTPPWHPPDGERVQEVLDRIIEISRPLRSPIVTISIQTPDPEWGKELLWALHQRVDNSLRAKTLERGGQYITYLNEQLARITVSSYRDALAGTLAEQEKGRMVASAGLPFAAEPMEPPTSGPLPAFPNARAVLLVGIVLGVAFGFAVAWIIECLKRPRTPKPSSAIETAPTYWRRLTSRRADESAAAE